MRRAATILLILCSAAALSAQATPDTKGRADHTADEAALSKMLSAFADAISAGNYKAAAAFWEDDGVYYSVEGQKVTGPAQIEAAFREALQGTRLSLRNSNVHPVTPDVAVTQGSWQANDGGGANSGLFMAVVRKSGPEWKFVEVRPWIPSQ
ncbi:MAG: nuclear transport factor 2 family protein [Acidobacteria bacterium]|nr:nuclear transport factor 2 family protein [Acidobacteriota bacterium]